MTHERTLAQELLLRAALEDGAPAQDAWRAWSRTNDLEDVDQASFRVLPQVYLNLSRMAREPVPHLAKLRGVYRHTWMRNQVALRAAAEALGALRQAEVAALLLDDIPLALRYYGDAGARLVDVAVHVRSEDLMAAVGAVERVGWDLGKPATVAELAPFVPAISVRQPGGAGVVLRLHLHPFAVGCPPTVERELWQRAVAIGEVGGVPALAPDATDLLLMACLRAGSPDAAFVCSWLADAVMLTRTAGRKINLAALEDRGRRLGLLPLVRDALDQLFPWAGSEVAGTRAERSCAAARTRAHPGLGYDTRTRRPVGEVLATHWWRYAQGARAVGRRRTPAGLFRYVLLHYQRAWAVRSLWRMPLRFAVELARAVRPAAP